MATAETIAAFRSAYALPEKPPYAQPCNHCGICCTLSLCHIGQQAFPNRSAPCPALVVSKGQAKCGLVIMEDHVGLEPVIRKSIGIGCGCSMRDDNTTDAQVAEFDAHSMTVAFGTKYA